MFQWVVIVAGLLQAVAGSLKASGNAIPDSLTSAINKAQIIFAAFQGLEPPDSIAHDLDDLHVVVSALEKQGVELADAHLANLQALVDRWPTIQGALESGNAGITGIVFPFKYSDGSTGRISAFLVDETRAAHTPIGVALGFGEPAPTSP